MMLVTPKEDRTLQMKVIDQDRYVRISYDPTARFVKMELMEEFNEMNIELLWDTLAILSDVITEQQIDKLLINSLSLSSGIRETLGGFELYYSILQFNDNLERLAILSVDAPCDLATNRITRDVMSEPKVQMFSDEEEAIEWAARMTSTLAF